MDKFLIDPVCVWLGEHPAVDTFGRVVFGCTTVCLFLKTCGNFIMKKDGGWRTLLYTLISLLCLLFFTHTKPTLYFVYGSIWLAIALPILGLFVDDDKGPKGPDGRGDFWKTMELYFLIRLLTKR